jgi:predicted phage tail component-like protein
MADMDFIGFSYNGKHSLHDLGIYRTSSGSRYNNNLTATMTDKTADVPGGDGQYYFGTTFKNRTFTVNYAFDNLTEPQLEQLKVVFDGKGIHDLIFDEAPDKIWSAKVTGTASIKYLCFDDESLADDYNRVYKGEGSITFTCYYPFAHSAEYYGGTGNATIAPVGGTAPTPFEVVIDFSNSIDLVASSAISSLTVNSNTITFTPAIVVNRNDIIVWDSKNGIVKKNNEICPYGGQGIQYLAPGNAVSISAEGNSLGNNYNLSIKYRYLYN